MAVIKRGKSFHLYLRPFFEKQITIKTPVRSKTEAKHMEAFLLNACRSGDYSSLDPMSREVCIRMFRNQGWELPASLAPEAEIIEELTFWKAAELFLRYPDVRDSQTRERYQQCLIHLVEKFGKDFPIKKLWIPAIKQYQIQRLNEGAAPATINREKSTLSKMLQVLVEMRLIDANPARFVTNLSEKSGERQVYLSLSDFEEIVDGLTLWLEPIVQTAFYTGMRQGEILSLRRSQVQLSKRMIVLAPESVKEAQWKRVPIHLDLIPIFVDVLKVRSLQSDYVFLSESGDAPVSRHSIKKPWHKAVGKMDFETAPRFHDLRHTWKTNARRSGMDPEIRETIMGHWFRERSVSERYGRISDAELIQAVDLMTFDHGETEILISGSKKEKPERGCNLSREKMLAEC